MKQVQKINPDPGAKWFATVLIIIFIGLYGSEVLAWILMKLYEYLIQKSPVSF